MARKKNPAKSDIPVEPAIPHLWLPADAKWGGFINVALDDLQKGQFHAWDAENHQHTAAMLDDAMGSGLKVALAWDHANECYTLALTGRLVHVSNERYCVTSRAGTMGEVIALAMWKHFVLLSTDYGDLLARTGRKRDWG